MRLLPGIRLSKRQREQVDEMIAAAVKKALDELAGHDTEAIGFKYEPVSNFED